MTENATLACNLEWEEMVHWKELQGKQQNEIQHCEISGFCCPFFLSIWTL
jgi:hypothetical protein